jgi:hypothetical protein
MTIPHYATVALLLADMAYAAEPDDQNTMLSVM